MMMNNEDILYVGVDWKVILFCATIQQLTHTEQLSKEKSANCE